MDLNGIPFNTDVLFKFSDGKQAVGCIEIYQELPDSMGYPVVSLTNEIESIFNIVAWQHIGEWNNVTIS